MMIIQAFGWATAVSTTSASRICGNASATSLRRMITSSHQPPGVRRDDADGDADHHADQGAEHGDHQHDLPAVQEPGPDVLAEIVGAEEAELGEGRAHHLVLAVRREQGGRTGPTG
jgi:hypothetical protein